MNFFRSRYVLFLEKQLSDLRQQYAEETERLKTLHAKEMERVITEANRGWAEADRLRQYLIPGLPASTRTESPDNTSPEIDETERGTPFQRLYAKTMKQYAEMDRLEAEERKKKEFPTPKVATPASPAKEKN